MPLAKRGRGVQRLIWVDENGVENFILLAYLGDQVVWDGHVHQSIQVPRAVSYAEARVPSIGAVSLLEPPRALTYSEALLPELVAAGVALAPPVAASTSLAPVPVLHTDQTVDAPTALSTSDGFAPTLQVVFGVTPPVALSTSDGYAPILDADVQATPPVATSYSQAEAPQIAALVIIDAPVATATSQGPVPAVSADGNVTPPVAGSTSQAHVPAVTAGSSLDTPTATSTSQAHVPDVTAAVTLVRQQMDKSGNFTTAGAQKVTGWTSDATYAATITSNALVLQGSGTVNITLSAAWSASFTTGQIRIYRNGAQIATSATVGNGGTVTSGTATVTANGVAATHGDTFEVYKTGNLAINSGTYLDVNPA